MNIRKTILYSVSNYGYVQVNLLEAADAVYKDNSISIFTSEDEAKAEYDRRCLASDVVASIEREEIEVIASIHTALHILQNRNSEDPTKQARAKDLIEFLGMVNSSTSATLVPFANVVNGRMFRFSGDQTIYTKISPTHYRKSSAGPHGCCWPISTHVMKDLTMVEEVTVAKIAPEQD